MLLQLIEPALPRSIVRPLALAVSTLALAACSTVVEHRVEDELTEAGVSPRMASCMAPIWAEDLSVEQIRGIGRFASALRDDNQTLTVARLIGHAREWNDPEALAVVTSSAARCAFS